MEKVWNLPIVLVRGQNVVKFYPNAYETKADGFSPLAVVLVCVGARKTHKGKHFCFASKTDIVQYDKPSKITERRC